jgi:protein-S-isoprenylcysteine O-methyltransferase Ste14
MTTVQKQGEDPREARGNILKRFAQVAGSILFVAIALFASAGTIDWLYAWLLIIASVAVIVVNAFIFPPELIAERGRRKENVERWDRVISACMILPWFAVYPVAGLDVRFGWSPVLTVWMHLMGLVVFLLGNALVSWSMVSNAYFSTAVRIQYERGHSVARGGPYRYVRHPGYLGMILSQLSTPFLLGSLWALVPAALTSILLVVRTALEDRTLKEKLEGYAEYAGHVGSRLLPGVW